MSLHFIGQRFRVSRGGCWQCLPDCRSRLSRGAEVSQVAYNGEGLTYLAHHRHKNNEQTWNIRKTSRTKSRTSYGKPVLYAVPPVFRLFQTMTKPPTGHAGHVVIR